MKKILKFFLENEFIKRAIFFQHGIYPIPLPIFKFLFSFKLIRKLFGFYGMNVYLASYGERKNQEENDLYWLSQESLYWHFWSQTREDGGLLVLWDEIILEGKLNGIFNNSTSVVELGFGLGKNYFNRWRNLNYKLWIGLEPNKFLNSYRERERELLVINETAQEFVNKIVPLEFDVLVCSNGVLMYLDNKVIDKLFSSLEERGVRCVIITNEGTWNEDTRRADNTTMYCFRKRLPEYKFFEKKRESGIYEYFVGYKTHHD